MASCVIIIPKVTKKQSKFFETIDKFLTAHDYVIVSHSPKTYINMKTLPPNKVKDYINTIKKIEEFKDNVESIYFDLQMQKL